MCIRDRICILLASKLSGTCQRALVAKDIVEYERIYIIDSMQATLGTQLLTERAFALQKEWKNAEQIVEILEKEKEKVCIYLIVDTPVSYTHLGILHLCRQAPRQAALHNKNKGLHNPGFFPQEEDV